MMPALSWSAHPPIASIDIGPTLWGLVGDSQDQQTIIAHEESPLPVQHHNFRCGPEQLRSAWSGADPGEPL